MRRLLSDAAGGDPVMNSKRKGNAGELELLHLLESSGLNAHRNQQGYVGGVDNPDIALDAGGERYHLEIKRTERFSLYPAMYQAERDANGHAVPVVVHRSNRKPWVCVLRLADFLRLVNKAP